MKKTLSYLLSPFFWIYFMLILGVFHPIQWLAYNIAGYQAHKRAVDLMNWFLLNCYRVMGTRLTFVPRPDVPLEGPLLFVSNHQSMFDIPGLIWFLRQYNPKFVSKKELGKGIPSISFNLNKSGAALIDRSNPEQALKEIERLGRFVQKYNYSVVLFPEGTRGRKGILKAFAVKGFSKFLESIPDVTIVPVAIQNSWRFAQYGSFPISFGEHISWKVLKPIPVGQETPVNLLAKAEKAIREELGQ